MSVLKKRDVHLATWFVIVVFLVALVNAIFRDQSKLPVTLMEAAFVFAVFKIGRVVDQRRNRSG
jgi:surface polysaccharide O-acyltransferase-like enzyme